MTHTATTERNEEVDALRGLSESGAVKQREMEELLACALREMTSEWFYDLELNGAEIEGIGIQGALELAAFRAEQGYPIRMLHVDVIDATRKGAAGAQATVIAREARTSREGVGIAFFPYQVDESEIVSKLDGMDPRADRKALSIAKRNAILDLIPDSVKQRILAERERAVPLNEARKENEFIAARNRNAVPVRTATPEQLRREANVGPYDDAANKLPSTHGTARVPATTRQIVRLAQLIAHPAVSEATRFNVGQHLETGLSEALAAEWIQMLEPQTKGV
jgi:hypothetical protein